MTWGLALLQASFIAISIAISISIDAFLASFAYGCKKIRMPLSSVIIITLICSLVIAISFLFGIAIKQHISETLVTLLSFSILFLIGLIKLFDSFTKSIILKYSKFKKEIKLSIFNFKLVMNIYANPEAADVNVSKSISPKEAIVLSVSLSLDGVAVGLGAAMIGVNGWILFSLTLIMGFLAILLGSFLGNRVASKLKFNISWLAGIIFIILAFIQLI